MNNRYPLRRVQHAILLSLSLVLLIVAFFAAVLAMQAASVTYAYDGAAIYRNMMNGMQNPSAGSMPSGMPLREGYNILLDTLIKVMVFSLTYLVGMLAAVAPMYFAEGVRLRVNMEDHLYHLRHTDKPLAELRWTLRENRVRAEINEEAGKRLGILMNLISTKAREGSQKVKQIAKDKALPAGISLLGSLRDQLAKGDEAPTSNPKAPVVRSTTTLSKMPTSSEALDYLRRAITYSKQEEYSKALKAFNKLLEIEPDYIEGYRMRSKCLTQLKQLIPAKDDMDIYQRLKAEQAELNAEV